MRENESTICENGAYSAVPPLYRSNLGIKELDSEPGVRLLQRKVSTVCNPMGVLPGVLHTTGFLGIRLA